ncbi:MAG: EF-hand domain-containing protein [Tunicatimonas sp.]
MKSNKLLTEEGGTILPEHISLSSQQTEEAMTLFNHYDINGDGTITKEELKKIMNSFEQPLDGAEVDEYFATFDVNKSDGIDLLEFLGVIKQWLAVQMNRLADSEALGSSFELDELRILVGYFTISLFSKGQVLQQANAPVDSVHILVSGVAVAEAKHARQLLTEGSIFGATQGAKVEAFDTQVTAETNGVLLGISIDQVAELVTQHPLITLKLNQSLDYKLTSMIAKLTKKPARRGL